MQIKKHQNHSDSKGTSIDIDLARLQVSIVRLASICQTRLDAKISDDIALGWSYLRKIPGLREERDIFWEAVHQYYMNGYPMTELSRRTGIGIGTISNNFKSRGLFVYRFCRKTEFAGPPLRTYSLDTEALSDPARDITAYVLGFTWADGTLMSSGTAASLDGLRFVLKESDSEHLKFLRAFFGSTAPVRYFHSSKHPCGARFRQCGLFLYSKKLARQLVQYGFAERNAGVSNASPPAEIRQNAAAFWRGMIDGDGCIRRDSRVKFPLSGWSVELAATRSTAKLFRDFILERFPEACVDLRPNGISQCNFRVAVSGPYAVKIIGLLYPPNTVGLKRKARLARWIRKAAEFAIQNGVEIGIEGQRAQWRGSKAAKAKVALALPPVPMGKMTS